MTDEAIWDAFCVALGAFAAQLSPAVPVIFQGVGGTPPEAGEWFEVRYFPNRTRNYGIAAEGPISMVGFLQVMVCARPAPGLAGVLALARDVMDEFGKGVVIGPAYVNLPPYASSVLEEPDRIMVPVTIPYAAHGTR